MKFADAINPTDDELRRWAADPNAEYPDEMKQDWDLVIADWDRADLIAQLASDTSCPNQDFFLRVLYLMAGDCVRNAGSHANLPRLRDLLERLVSSDSGPLLTFRSRTQRLLADPSKFDYDFWCDGGFLRVNDEAARES